MLGDPDELAGRLCRVVLRGGGPGPRNLLVQLEDGTRHAVIWRALRKARAKDRQETLL